jgi:hypothetical protein
MSQVSPSDDPSDRARFGSFLVGRRGWFRWPQQTFGLFTLRVEREGFAYPYMVLFFSGGLERRRRHRHARPRRPCGPRGT